MENSRIIEIMKAAHEIKMSRYWKEAEKMGEVNGFVWLLDNGILTENEIPPIEHSLQMLGGEAAAKIAESEELSKDDITREMAISKAIRDTEQSIRDSEMSGYVNNILVCIASLILFFLSAYFLLYTQQIVIVKILLVIAGLAGLITGVIGVEYALKRREVIKKAHSLAMEQVTSDFKDKLWERNRNLDLLYKIDQCLEIISSRYY